ncbi:putative two-component response regulator-like APRR6 [Quercus robur]|uniref:putative two-component response regulator-like APRR6 n=1 Tax=Quercus robur TaxID=38942 RepID=UPI0021625F4F|nr:putative two-component response regulator-like APRR6 [Quercus robur]
MDGMGSDELISSVPNFARGLDILLVDHETASLMYLASLLEQYTFKVTTTEVAAVALSMIHEDEHRFRLVIANMKMPDMDRLSFLDILLKKKIPIILMSSEKRFSVAQRALAEGAWYFLETPVLLEDLKYIWQHAYRKRKDLRKEFQKENIEGEVNHISSKDQFPQGIEMKEAGCVTSPPNGNASCDINQYVEASMFEENYVREPQHEANFVEENQVREPQCNCNDRMKISEGHQQGGTNILRSYSNIEDKQQERRTKFSSEQTNFFTIKTPEEQETQRKDSNYRSSKKARFLWTTELHLKFTAALSLLGDKRKTTLL